MQIMRHSLLGEKKLALNSISVLFQSREAKALEDWDLEPSQPLPRILSLNDTRVSVLGIVKTTWR